MLGTAEFYKSTPKIMPKSSKAKPVIAKREASPVPIKKRRVPSTMKSEDKKPQLPSQRTSERIRTLRSSNIKKEVLAVKQELVEEEDEEEAVLLGNQESDGDDSSSDTDSDVGNGELSAYERKRLQNIQENALFFASLGISKTKKRLEEHSATTAVQKASTRGLKTQKRVTKKAELPPRRPLSLRLRRIDPEGLPLPDLPAPLVFEESVHEQKPSGPLEMEPVNISDEDGENLLAPLCKSITELSKSPKGTATVHPQDLATFKKTMQGMRLVPERVAKVTKDRIFSVAFHPSETKLIACAGDKWGKIGAWDVDSQEGDDGVYLFEPHSRPVSCLKFAPANPVKLFSCSYDGTARCGNFEHGVFDEIKSTDESDDIHCPHFDFLSPDGTKLLLGQNLHQGHVIVVDSRQKCRSTGAGFWLHNRYLKTIHVRPTNENHFVTACNDGTVALWDLRTLKDQGRCKSISAVPHGRSVSSAYFSPLTGNKIVTTAYDDQIRILNVNETGKLDVEHSISHNNHTGRWLTTFWTVWHPRREDVILVGSMKQPRRMDVLDINGRLLHSPLDADYLGSVCSITVWHPHRDIIAGANSSGRVHVFM